MLQRESIIKIADNSAKECLIIGLLKNKKYASVGDVIVVVIKSCFIGSNLDKGQTSKAVVVRTKKQYRRKDGSYVSFSDNACVLLNDKGEMRGTRVFGPVARELRDTGYVRIISLASEVL